MLYNWIILISGTVQTIAERKVCANCEEMRKKHMTSKAQISLLFYWIRERNEQYPLI